MQGCIIITSVLSGFESCGKDNIVSKSEVVPQYKINLS